MTTPVQQLVFTSVPQGLRPNTRGFTTVAASSDMSPPLVSRLESMSGYELTYNLSDARSEQNPVALSHVLLETAGQRLHVLSRVAPAGADYSGRSNTLAHHLVLDDSSLPPAGPAATLRNPGLLMTQWSGQPRYLDEPVSLDDSIPATASCTAWKLATGDAGWGGALAGAFVRAPHLPVYLIYAPGTDVLELINESMSLLDLSIRWQVTFSTYFTAIAQGITCNWRCALQGSAAAKAALAGSGLVIDLTRSMESPAPSPFTEAARAGRIVEIERPIIARTVIQPTAKVPSRARSIPSVNTKVAQDYEIDESRVAAIAASVSSAELEDDTGFHYEPVPKHKRSPALMAAAIFLMGVVFGAIAMWLFKPDARSLQPVPDGNDIAQHTPDGNSVSAVEKPVPPEDVEPAIAGNDDKQLSIPKIPAVTDESRALAKDNPPASATHGRITAAPNVSPASNKEAMPENKTITTIEESEDFSNKIKLLREAIGGGTIVQAESKNIKYEPHAIKDSGLTIELSSVPAKILILRSSGQITLEVKAEAGNRFTIGEPIKNRIPGAAAASIGTLLFETDPKRPGGVMMTWTWEAQPNTVQMRGNHIGVVMDLGEEATTHVLYSAASLDDAPAEVFCQADQSETIILNDASKTWVPFKFGPNENTPFIRNNTRPKNTEEYLAGSIDKDFSLSRLVDTTAWKINWKSTKEASAISDYNDMIRRYHLAVNVVDKNQKQVNEYAKKIQELAEEAKGQRGRNKERTEDDVKAFEEKEKLAKEDLAKSKKVQEKLNGEIKSQHKMLAEYDELFAKRVDLINQIVFVDRFGVPVTRVKLTPKSCVQSLPK